VKPILKKLSHSEKNSLDLDRGWEEQNWGVSGMPIYETASAGRSARDVSFSLGESSHGFGAGSGGAGVGFGSSSTASFGKPRFGHARSTSGTSVATNGSGAGRAGTFVHPFQQIPRTATPPLSYAPSLASFDNAVRDHSPTITENEDDDDYLTNNPLPHIHHAQSSSISQSSLRRPSLASQRTSSLSDINNPQLRITTSRSVQSPSSRLAQGSLTSSLSHSDLHLNLVSSTFDSPMSIAPPPPGASLTSPISPLSCSTTAPMSPLRTSLDSAVFPRLRSRSEVDRAQQIQIARRKFDERERAKEDKYDREQLKKRERQETKEAKEFERQARKNSMGAIPGDLSRPAASRKNTPTNLTPLSAPAAVKVKKSTEYLGRKSHSKSRSDLIGNEKQPEFLSSNYASVEGGRTPKFAANVEDVQFQTTPRRAPTAKRKTQSYWTGFILWLRTRLFRLGKK